MGPIRSNGFQFYDPNSTYGRDEGLPDFVNSPLYDWTSELDRKAYYTRLLGQQGLNGLDNESDWSNALFDKLEEGYAAGRMTNPNLTWKQYADAQTPNLRRMYAETDMASRGIRENQWTNGARWLPRS